MLRTVACTRDRHAESILAIFNDAIVHSTALYDYSARPLSSMDAWFAAKVAGGFPVIGIESESGELLGFASYGVFRAWPAYKYTVEHAVYVHKDHRGSGLGMRLMGELIAAAMAQNRHVLVGCIDASNQCSIALHERLGFAHAGTIKHAGFKFGRWLDVALYQLVLDTPSEPVDG